MTLQYDLRRQHHAIGEFQASLHFFQPVSASTFSLVTEALRKLAEELDLPAPSPVQVFQFMIGPQGPAPSSTLGGGLGFQRFSKEGEVAESISCDANSITYVLRDYSLWEEVSPKLVRILTTLSACYIKEVPAIESIRLQYLNEFKSTSAEVKSAAELFREGSRWVAPLGYQVTEAWHCHVGVFVPHDANERRLVNVNCDISPTVDPTTNQSRILAKVLIMAGCFFNVPGGKPLIVPTDKLEGVLREKLDQAHKLEKDVLRDLVTDSYLDAIGANDAD